MSKERDPGKERFWRRVIRRWQRSGLSARAFCVAEGLSEPSLYAWRRILVQRDAQATHFVPVRVIAAAADKDDVARDQAAVVLAASAANTSAANTSAANTSAANTSAGDFELLLAGGRRLRIGAGFDEATLRRLLAVLEEGRPCC